MLENIIAFTIWLLFGLISIVYGTFTILANKPIGFWANVKRIEVTDVKKYNKSLGILFILYGIIFIIMGLPILYDINSPLIFLSIIGIFIETIITMIVYMFFIENKYRKK